MPASTVQRVAISHISGDDLDTGTGLGELAFEEAAGVAVVFTTAYYGLRELAMSSRVSRC